MPQINGHRSVTPETAIRLGRLTGTEAEFWLNLQQPVDLWDALHSDSIQDIDKIEPVAARTYVPRQSQLSAYLRTETKSEPPDRGTTIGHR